MFEDPSSELAAARASVPPGALSVDEDAKVGVECVPADSRSPPLEGGV